MEVGELTAEAEEEARGEPKSDVKVVGDIHRVGRSGASEERT